MANQYDALFSGVIGKDYEMLNLICPLAVKMSHLVGETLKNYAQTKNETLTVVGIRRRHRYYHFRAVKCL
jgi:tRNA (cmo5U34)-methyltransferase